MTHKIRLEDLLDHSHEIYRLTHVINWKKMEEALGSPTYTEGPGRPATPTRLILGLHLLKYLENKSDEEAVYAFVQNPYWQYFCGCTYFEHEYPIHPTTMTKWRKKTGVKKIEKVLEETIDIAQREKWLSPKDFHHINVDTTVQEKAITFPTDAKLCNKARIRLVKLSKKHHLNLRQTYIRVGQRALKMQARYAHARQMNRARRELRKIRTYLGRVIRDIERKMPKKNLEIQQALDISKRILHQKRHDKNKIYSVHEPGVECIAKGKSHKKYEFGCKVSVATTSLSNWVVGIEALHDNPYDGHTLKGALESVKACTGVVPKQVFVDAGYRGKSHFPKDSKVFVAHIRRKVSVSLRRFFRRRSAIEPVIGHLKSDHRMNRNFLKGVEGDKMNAVLSGCAYNLRKMVSILRNSGRCQEVAV